MRTPFVSLMFVVAVSVVTASARGSSSQSDRGSFGDSAAACRLRASQANGLALELVEARTVFLNSEPGSPDSGQEDVRHELQRWRRWVEVSRRDAADVILSTSVIHGEGGGTPLQVAIRARASGTVLWVSSGRDVAAAFKTLERQLPSLEGCAPIQVL